MKSIEVKPIAPKGGVMRWSFNCPACKKNIIVHRNSVIGSLLKLTGKSTVSPYHNMSCDCPTFAGERGEYEIFISSPLRKLAERLKDV